MLLKIDSDINDSIIHLLALWRKSLIQLTDDEARLSHELQALSTHLIFNDKW